MRTIAVVTGSRADYGHLYWLMRILKEDKRLKLQVMVTGSHLSRNFGLTCKQIEKDEFDITAEVPVLTGDNSASGVGAAIGKGCIGFSKVFKKYQPDVIVVLGDRFEILASVIAAYIMNIPIVHLHGGEATRGVIDEGIRHSITKMSSLHCTSTEIYRRRVIQLGENPKNVFYTGSPGLDQVQHLHLLTKEELAKRLGLDLTEPVLLVTYHPLTLDRSSPVKQIQEILKSIESSGFQAVFTKANADPQGMIINKAIEAFCQRQPCRHKLFDSLGQPLYYSCLLHLTVMVGNSSSGLVEAPSFRMPVVNIGDRQQDRVRAANVLDVTCQRREILKAIHQAASFKFRNSLKRLKNPYDRYGDGKTSWRIKEIIRTISLDQQRLKKQFFDLKVVRYAK